MIVQSGNDATVALAEGVGGTVEVFVEMMNRQAQVFGLKGTPFATPEGLTAPGHVSTARELSIIATRLITDFPNSLPYYSMKEFTFNGIKQGNRNALLYTDPSVDGLKTGHTSDAGYCLVTSSKRDGMRLITVILNTHSAQSRADRFRFVYYPGREPTVLQSGGHDRVIVLHVGVSVDEQRASA